MSAWPSSCVHYNCSRDECGVEPHWYALQGNDDGRFAILPGFQQLSGQDAPQSCEGAASLLFRCGALDLSESEAAARIPTLSSEHQAALLRLIPCAPR